MKAEGPAKFSAETRYSTGHARGAAPSSGLNFQAVVTAIAAVHLLEGSRIGWLDELVDDTPVAIWAESGGPGDDVRLELKAATVEVQAKRGLSANQKLWEAMLSLAEGVRDGRVDFGVLAVSPDSSRTVRLHLEQDLRHIGNGRRDRLHEVGRRWISQFEANSFDPTEISRAIRIQTVAATDGNVDAVRAAKAALVRSCGDEVAAELAWQTLVGASHSLIARKGRWDLLAVVRLLTAAGVRLVHSNSPGGIISRAVTWAKEANQTFNVFGASQPILLNAAWIPLSARLIDPADVPTDPAIAIARYRGLEHRALSRDREEIYDGEFLGRFKRRCVVIAGPGLGKSTLLRRQAQRYSSDGYPVLRVQLRKVAASLAAGETFESTVVRQGLDGSGIDTGRIASVDADGWVLLADGFDECGSAQEAVADALRLFSIGHPSCRIIVTTRPIGYETLTLREWSHYELNRPDSSAATANLGRLIDAVAPDGNPLKSAGLAAASEALNRSKPANAVANDPQLLGMAASLIVRGEPLGRSRIELFQKLFSSVERSVAAAAADGDIDLDVCHAVMNRVGWLVTADPLASLDTVLADVTGYLAVLLGATKLAASRQARTAVRFWEKVGLVERIHYRQTPLLAFVHKSFGELAAARYLSGLDDPSTRTRELQRIAGSSQWSEVLNFGAGLGLGTQVVEVLLMAGELVRALEIAADPAVELPDDVADHLVEVAFARLDSGHDQIKIGSALSSLAARHPGSVGSRAAQRLEDPSEGIQRYAWACVVEAGPDYHDPDDAARRAVEMLKREGPAMRTSLMGGIQLTSNRLDITRRMAVTNLRLLAARWSPADVEDHVLQLTGNGSASSVGFLRDVAEIIQPLGIHPHWPIEGMSGAFDVFRHDSEYGKAEARAVAALLDAIGDAIAMDADDVPVEPLDPALHPLIQLSGLIRIIDFWHVSGGDVWAWSETWEREPVAELLRIVIYLSKLDAARLAREVATIRRKLSVAPRETFFWALGDVPHVHIDDPQWERLGEASPDLQMVERAIAHKSEWVVQLATEILANVGSGAEDVARMLAGASGLGFASAGHLAVQLPEPTGSALIFGRLEGEPAIGIRHLFRVLASSDIKWTGRAATIVEKHLLGSSEAIASAAAEFVLAQVEGGADVTYDLLWRSYRHWQLNEPRLRADGAIPDSPRDALFKALLKSEQVDDDALIEASADWRHDVSKMATDRLLARAALDSRAAKRIGEGIENGSVGPRLVRQLLAAGVPLDPDTVASIARRLEDSDPRWRLAALGILQGGYALQNRAVLAEKLRTDEHAEIREAAARIPVKDAL